MDAKYSLISVNTGGIRSNDRRDLVINYCEQLDADFSILQETHINISSLAVIKEIWEGDILISPGTTQSKGVLVLAKKNAPAIEQITTDPSGRYIFFKIKNTDDAVLAIYAPSGMMKERRTERQMFLRKIKRLLHKKISRKTNLILIGDFNVTLGNKDKSTGDKGTCESQEELLSLITEFDLEDLWRQQNPNGRLYTHHHGRTNTYSRIDRAYTSTSLRINIKINHEINSFSDHFQTIILEREPAQFKRGKGYWILNCSLLQNKEYVEQINHLWKNWQTQQEDFRTISEWWEEGKKHIRAFTKLFTRASTTEQEKTKAKLKKQLRNIYLKIDNKPHLQNLADRLRNELKQIEIKEAKGAKIRAKIKWDLEGEKCTKYFFQKLEKRKNTNQLILSLKEVKSGKVLTDHNEILDEVKNYYEQLYSEKQYVNFSNSTSIFNPEISNSNTNFNPKTSQENTSNFNVDLNPNFSNSYTIFNPLGETQTLEKIRLQNELLRKVNKKISTENKRECEKDITLDDIVKAIKSFDNHKSPGNDGLPAEFYKTFINVLKPDLFKLYTEISQKEEMPASMRQAVISCLYKKGDREDITNWRPISLLNYDNKIYTKVLANKIQPTLGDIIGSEQTAAIKGRTIIENLQLNRDLMSYANANKIQAAMIALDQEKAFDRVNWAFLFKTLHHFGYGPKIIAKIRAVYNNIEAQVKVNGHLSRTFLLERGVRQGCPLSMILYIIFAEVLLENIRQNHNIKGIKIGQKEIKISAFADDTVVYIGDNKALKHLQKQLNIFEKATDVKYNKTKCMGLWLGSNKGNTSEPMGFQWTSQKIKLLGYTYSFDPNITYEENWEKIRKKINEDIRKWIHLNLSLIGKRIIINQVMLSKIWYLAYVERPPEKIIQKIRKDIHDFLWNYRKVRVNRNTLTLPVEMGGLALIDIETQCKAIQCSIIAKFHREINKNKIWTKLMLWHLDQYRNAKQGSFIFKTYIGNTSRAPIPPTYRQFLEAWSDMTGNEIPAPKTLVEIYNEPIFFNTHSDNINNPSYFLNKPPPVWAKDKFKIVKDLCNATHKGFITANELINSHTPRKHIHNPKQQDYIEILRLIPQDWQNKIKNQISTLQPSITKINIISRKGKWQEKNIAVMQCKDLYRTLHNRKIIPQCTQRKFEAWQDNSNSPKLAQAQWEHLFKNLHKNTKQREAFDIRYKFLHFAQPSAIKLREIGQNYGNIACKRCGYAEETQRHWLFYCPSSQNIFIYLLNLLEYIDITQVIDNTIQDCLLLPLLELMHEMPVSNELFEIYFITIRHLRKDATYDKKYSREKELEIFKNNIRERLSLLYNIAKTQQTEESFLNEWGKIITRNGNITLPQ